MRLYLRQVDVISSEIITTLTRDGDIEVTDRIESELDVASVLKEYIRVDKELSEKAKDILEVRGLSYSDFGRTKRTLAEKSDFGLGDRALSWISTQLIGTFLQSHHIDEIFAEDIVLRRKLKEILHRYMAADEDIDEEAKNKIKNLQDGTEAWEIEYKRAVEIIKRKRGMEQ